MKNWSLTSIIDYYLCLFILELMPFLNMIICAWIIISVIADKLTLEDAVRWVTSVSYTHLDVYKRQYRII